MKPFATILQMQTDGKLHEELSEAFHDLVEAVSKHQKGGSLTLVLKVGIDTKMQTPVITVEDKVVVKAPQPQRPRSMFYLDKTGNPAKEHPAMQPLLDTNLRVVPGSGEPPQQVDRR